MPLSIHVLTLASDKLVMALQERTPGTKQAVRRLPERPIRQLLPALNFVDRSAVITGDRAKLRLGQLSRLPEGRQRRADLVALFYDDFRFPADLVSFLVRSG